MPLEIEFIVYKSEIQVRLSEDDNSFLFKARAIRCPFEFHF